ncbi:type II toxin-antitoxin system death-on-curing family toxin [Chromohalobacter israelensis]|uniref:type II toxin-antitoxin system death-on-curing family toxin n=1 Tax=Chromohalobacter israelensis TaxID=141390 RepID=UPI000FFF2E96|nr:type II toxin-antitoxin system death-on-curing family toxin [Chromohalobacter salexigens]RXE48699.1 N-acetylglucosamine-6-phosphate deacetylase [Chromohalobacter salexigens]
MASCEDPHSGIRFLPVCDIISMNRRMLELTPDEPHAVINQGGLESAQCRPSQYMYFAQNDDIFKMAAVLGSALVQNHCFANANKRTAAGCVFDFLMLNGYELTAPEDDVVAMYAGIAVHQYDDDEFSDWLAYWSREYDTSDLNE